MSTLTTAAYLVSSVLFILSLRGLSHPSSARRGNFLGILGMTIAIVTTLSNPGVLSYKEIGIAFLIGGLIGTSIRVDEAVHAFEKLSEMIILAAEGETTMKKLLDEIESTKRRVNALEFKVIPNLEEIAKYISFRLEELERESIFGLKRIKG